MTQSLTKISQALISAYDKDYSNLDQDTISVNPVVAELASWYEKFRTAMEYRDDEVILRSAIERILKRRVLLNGSGEGVAAPLIRELIWARYFPDSTVAEAKVGRVSHIIDLYLKLEATIIKKHKFNRNLLSEWIFHLLSSEIEEILKPSPEKEIMINFMFKIFQNKISIVDDSEEVKDIQLFIAIRRSYANEDLALLRYALFRQYFGQLSQQTISPVSSEFPQAFQKINENFRYPQKDRIYSYIKSQTIPFIILDDVLKKNKGKNFALFTNQEELNLNIINACNIRYKSVISKVRRAVIRSVVFIIFTKAIFAIFVEGTFEKLIYARVYWSSIALNTLIAPILMVLVGLSIETPTRANSYKIMQKINSILYDEEPMLNPTLVIKKSVKKLDPIIGLLFILLWLLTFVFSLGAVIFLLNKLDVNPISQTVFIFFLAIVSFLSYRIQKTASAYILRDKKEGLGSLLFDFFFMPFIYAGRRLTTAISQINIILFIFDYIIEAPFKGIVAFFEQWLLFLRTQREKLD